MMYKNKTFDCVKMKHDIQRQLYEELNPTSMDDYYLKLSEYAKKSKLWQEFQARSKKRV